MAVADVFTAIAENRPYRAGMKKKEILHLLYSMAGGGHLNGDLVGLLSSNYGRVNKERKGAQKRAAMKYRALAGAGKAA